MSERTPPARPTDEPGFDGLIELVRQFGDVTAHARSLGLFVADRDLLECPACGLMEDVLIEPYGGEILGLSVASTTSLTATLAIGGLVGFGYASRVLGRGADPMRIAGMGAVIGLPAFALVMLAAPWQSTMLFGIGIFLIGAGGGLFGQ